MCSSSDANRQTQRRIVCSVWSRYVRQRLLWLQAAAADSFNTSLKYSCNSTQCWRPLRCRRRFADRDSSALLPKRRVRRRPAGGRLPVHRRRPVSLHAGNGVDNNAERTGTGHRQLAARTWKLLRARSRDTVTGTSAARAPTKIMNFSSLVSNRSILSRHSIRPLCQQVSGSVGRLVGLAAATPAYVYCAHHWLNYSSEYCGDWAPSSTQPSHWTTCLWRH